MPLTLQAGESDFGWRSVPDVGVVEALSGELGAAGSFGDAGVGTESSGRSGLHAYALSTRGCFTKNLI